MSYVLNPEFKLDQRSTDMHGEIYFVTRDDIDGKTIVLDEPARMLVERLVSNQPYDASDGERQILDRLVLEGVASRIDERDNTSLPSAENLNFWIQTSDKCNLACTYCYIPSLNSTKERRTDLFFLLGKKLLEVKGLRNVAIKLAGGEPLLTFDSWATQVLDLKKLLAEKNISLQVRIITNLTFLNKKIIDYIKSNEIGISVSLDGLKKFNDKNRIFPADGRGSFKVVKKNLDILKESGLKPGVMITATSENSTGISELVDSLVADDFVFRISDAKGGHIKPQEFSIAFTDVKRSISHAVKKGFPVSERIVVSDLRTLSPQANPCSMGTTGAALYLDGSIYFCHTEFEEGTPVGSLDEDENLLNIIRRGYPKHLGLSSDCRACEYRFVCAGGCPLYRINGKSPMCSAYKSIIPQIFELYEEEKTRL